MNVLRRWTFILTAVVCACLPTLPTGPALAATCAVTPNEANGVSTQTIAVPSTGTYKAWSRISVPDQAKNSYFLQIDADCAINVGDAPSIPINTWTWVDYQDGNTATKTVLSLTAGSHSVKLINREDTVKVDALLLLSDQACIPTGLGTNCASADSTPPSTPTNLTASPSGTQVALSWTASTDNVSVAGYKIMRGGTQIATSTGASYTDTSVVSGSTYSYTVVAYDTSGNTSGSSNQVSISVPATTKTGDLNGDNFVNIFDLSILLSHWNQTGTNIPGDINHDGSVNIFDLSALLSAWGT